MSIEYEVRAFHQPDGEPTSIQRPLDGLGARGVAVALDTFEIAIVVFSAEQTVKYFNRSAGEMFLEDERLELPLLTGAWQSVLDRRTWSGTIELRRPGGPRRFRIDLRLVASPTEAPDVLLVGHDITELERLRSIADSVNLSDNLGHFLSGIRHELGNPVNSIKTALSVLQSNLGSFPRQKVAHYIDRVLGEVGRIEYLLCSLRSFSRHESVTLDRVDVEDVVRKVIALARPSVLKSEGRLLFESSLARSVPITADVRALYQILLNLISNAIEAQSGPTQPTIHIEVSVGREFVDIAVIDNGHGMSPEEMAMAMRPFYTTKRSGTGLGLVIAQRLAVNQGGQLHLYSEPGRGTRAVVSLARASQEST